MDLICWRMRPCHSGCPGYECPGYASIACVVYLYASYFRAVSSYRAVPLVIFAPVSFCHTAHHYDTQLIEDAKPNII